jgi:hypothetical protein
MKRKIKRGLGVILRLCVYTALCEIMDSKMKRGGDNSNQFIRFKKGVAPNMIPKSIKFLYMAIISILETTANYKNFN